MIRQLRQLAHLHDVARQAELRARREHDRWSALARYNAEVARGIVHTPEWRARMEEDQRQFDAEQAKHYQTKEKTE
jgi:hypothetical protein